MYSSGHINMGTSADDLFDKSGKNKNSLHYKYNQYVPIEKQLKIEFNTHKQKLLNSMHSYISHKDVFSNDKFLICLNSKLTLGKIVYIFVTKLFVLFCL